MNNLYKLTLSLALLIFTSAAFAAEKDIYSYGPDGKNYYQLATDKILIKFNKELSFEEKQNILSAFRVITPLKKENVLPAPDVTMAEVQNLTAEGLENLLKQLQANPDVEFANPFLIYSDGTYQGIQDRVIIRLFTRADYGKLEAKAKELNVQVVERDEYDQNVFILGTTKNSKGNALEIANKFYESGQFDYAEPDFLLLLKKFNTNDPFLGYQWALNNTGSSIQFNGTPGADMNVFSAWGITAGAASVKVAIIDEGVDLTHNDLTPNLLGGYDATGLGSGGGPAGNDAHGTACAGIVAGVGNNSFGIAGVAYNCKIIPVRIAYSNAQGNWVTSNTWIGNAINWAWQTGGAHILSNSWGGGSSSSTINNAITAAVTNGRGGLGSPVLFAAGNNNGANSYPATLSNTISVIAMSMCYQRKNPASCDGENWWGSNYGAGADVAAPGVKIYTTDISGSAGYSTGDHVPNFNGTSSATPNAAGVMALILSANPTLTATQARFALESTCRKVGSYTYNSNVSGQPNGTWSNDLGYGVVSAYQAVLSVSQVPLSASISSSTNVSCNGGNNGSATGSATGGVAPYTYLWSNGANGATASGLSAGVYTLTVTGANSAQATAQVTITQPAVLAATASGNNVSCNGGSNGSASVSVSGGTAPYSYLWNNGGNGSSVSGLVAGNYSVTVTDSKGCTANGAVTITQPTALSVSASSVNATCNGASNGSASASASGGTAPYSYAWSNGANGENISGLAAGNYSVTVTDARGCIANAPVSVSQPDAILLSSSTLPASCGNATDGSIDLNASGGAGSFTYLWSNGAITEDLTGVTAGTYSVTVTDASGCTANTSAVVGEQSTLSASASAVAVSCNGGSNGSASVSANGGTAPYTYLWNNAATTDVVPGLAAGNYSVAITDAAGCSAQANTSVSEPSALSVSVSSTSETCTANDGSATASASGGTAPYSYSWSNGANTATASGLAADSYSVTITDANGCSAENNVTVVYDCVGCNYEIVNSNNFESGLGIWTDGGTDCSRLSNATYASSGTYTVQLRDNSTTSLASTGNLNLSVYEEVTVSLSFITTGFSSGEDFWLQLSTNGGASYTTVKAWVMNTDFNNNQRQNVQVVINGPFTSTSRLRLYCDASSDADVVYIDDVVISGCRPVPNCTYQDVNDNNFESSLGIWTDGGTDCSRISNATYASSGTYSVQLRDNSTTSLMSTGNLNLSTYQELTVSFSFITTGFSSGEDFWLQLSSNGGTSYSTVRSWVMNTDFFNNQRQNVQVILNGPFASNSRLRFRSDASDDSDALYIDDVNIDGCQPSGSGKTDETNEETILIQPDIKDDVSIYPNPAAEELNVLYTATGDKELNVMITDMVGKVVISETIKIDEGQNRLSYNLSNLSNGVYSVTFINATERINKRLVISR